MKTSPSHLDRPLKHDDAQLDVQRSVWYSPENNAPSLFERLEKADWLHSDQMDAVKISPESPLNSLLPGKKTQVNEPLLTRAEVMSIVDERVRSLRVYVLESDITEAQQGVRSIVEMASY